MIVCIEKNDYITHNLSAKDVSNATKKRGSRSGGANAALLWRNVVNAEAILETNVVVWLQVLTVLGSRPVRRRLSSRHQPVVHCEQALEVTDQLFRADGTDVNSVGSKVHLLQ